MIHSRFFRRFPVPYRIIRRGTSLLAALALVLPLSAQAADGVAVGFQDARGNTLFLHDFKGRPMVLNLWASWCAPCLSEMPSLSKLQADYKVKGLVVAAISEDDLPAPALEKYKTAAFKGLTPFFDNNHRIFQALKAPGLPITLLVDKNGVPFHKIEGPVDWNSKPARGLIDQLIAR